MKTISSCASFRRLCLVSLTALLAASFAAAQQRPPAVPLVAHNPYFSIWSMADKLTDQDTKHWTGSRQPIAGLARIDGKTYRFMGAQPRDVPAMEQTSLVVTPTHSIYTFQADGVTLTVSFFTPAFPRDLDVLSRPVTYLTFSATAQGDHELSVLIDVDPVIAVNTPIKPLPGAARACRASPFSMLARAISRFSIVPVTTSASTGDTSISPFRCGRSAAQPCRMTRSAPLRPPAPCPQPTTWTCPACPAAATGDAAGISPLSCHWASFPQHPSAATSCSPTPRTTPSNTLAASSGPTGSATASPSQQMLATAESEYSALEQRGQKFDRRTDSRP